MSKDWVEMVPFSEEALTVPDAKLLCEVSGKKSIIRSLLTGSMSIRQAFNLLSTDSEKPYVYASEPYVFDPKTVDPPPFLHVRNFSAGHGINDFEEIMRCFDINVLSHDRFLGERKAKKPSANALDDGVKNAASATAVGAAGRVSPSSTPVTKSSSPGEWLGKIRDAKDDFFHKIQSSSSSSSSAVPFPGVASSSSSSSVAAGASPSKRFAFEDIFGAPVVPNKSEAADSKGRELKEVAPRAKAQEGAPLKRGFFDDTDAF